MSVRFEAATVAVRTPEAHGPGGVRTILDAVTASLDERRVAVLGANGSGKSTLLRLVNGLMGVTSGRVLVDGLDVAREGRAVRARVGFVFTDPLSQLVMPTPIEDVELSLRRGVRERARRRALALELLDARGVGHVAHSSIYDLSGGERQLVALASVLAVEPSVLVLDEPTTLLDLRNRLALRETLAGLPQQLLLATHDLELAADADRVLVIEGGRLVFDGAPGPAVAFYRELMGDAPAGERGRPGRPGVA